jgi:GNAT superfamily N-acetyltransferase
MIRKTDVRPASAADLPFMAEMALLAAFPPGPLPDGASAVPRAVRWTDGWGRDGDAGVVAWHHGKRIGAAWCRVQADRLALDKAGNPLAQIAIAVLEGHRSRGVGQALLLALDGEARAAGHSALCLSVNALNPAFRLYERGGFVVAKREGSRLTMVKQLDGRSLGD